MVQARKRVSYILPPPSESTPFLQLPSRGVSRLGAVGPLLITSTPSKSGHKGVFPSPQQPRHRLGIASLALDTSTHLVGNDTPEGILYSGGRDGLIMSWDLGIQMKQRKKPDSSDASRAQAKAKWEALTGLGDDAIDEASEDDERRTGEEDFLGNATPITAKRKREAMFGDIPYERRWEMDMSAFEAGIPTSFRQGVQAHGDWVNDILLCNRNQTVISASSDGTLKAWNAHAEVLDDPTVIGYHSDYVRCLAHCREKKWIASGSFDRTIKIWDLSSVSNTPLATLSHPDTSAPKASIYALAVDPFGQIIASGSPERVIRLWDPRTSKRIGKLVGHTDNIRAILISEDSKYLLTGSADASIKLWSLASQRCLHTFAHHTESVWSLFSNHPSLEVFYSGDRSGLVCRVDLEDCADLSEGECVLLCNDTESGKPSSEGINKIAVMDDNLLWTASGTSTLRRWNIPSRRSSRLEQDYLDSEADRYHPFSHPMETNVRFTTEPVRSGTLSGAPSLGSLRSERLRDREGSKGAYLPYDGLIKLVSANDPFPHFGTRTRDPDVATLYSAASVMSIPRLSSKSPATHVHTPRSPNIIHGSRTDDTVSNTLARTKHEESEFAADAIPICSEPDFVIPGDSGLVRCVMLNDRIHALSVDTLGAVAVWDVIRGLCLGRYSPEEISKAIQSERPKEPASDSECGEMETSPREALDLVKGRIEGEAVVLPWCMADTKAGVLTIHLMEKWFESEVYADEIGFALDRHFNEDSKVNLGKWVLRNLFMGFVNEELRRIRTRQSHAQSISRASSQEMMDSTKTMFPPATTSFPSISSTLFRSSTMKRAVLPVGPALVRSSPLVTPLIPLSHLTNLTIPQSPTPGLHVRSRSSDAKDDYLSSRLRQGISPVSSEDLSPSSASTPGGLMGRLRNLGRTKRPPSDTPSITTTAAADTTISDERNQTPEAPKTPIQNLLAGPLNLAVSTDAPTMSSPTTATVLISEEGSPGYTVVYRALNSDYREKFFEALEEVMPLWLAEYLFLNQCPPVPAPIKLSFVLVPWNKDPGVEPLPDLLNTQQSKLTANRNLRIRKILSHVQDRLERLSNSSRAASIISSVDGSTIRSPLPKPQAEEVYEIICNDTTLPLGMTLAAVRQYVWKSNAELVMVYRKKKKT